MHSYYNPYYPIGHEVIIGTNGFLLPLPLLYLPWPWAFCESRDVGAGSKSASISRIFINCNEDKSLLAQWCKKSNTINLPQRLASVPNHSVLVSAD